MRRNSVIRPTAFSRPLRVGYVPLCDSAPLVLAQELGLYAKHGLRVQLSREPGWATVRDKIIYGELDAAHALAPMAFAMTLGLGSVRADCVAGAVLSVNGNAITLSRAHFNADHSLRPLTRREPFVFGIPFLHSAHHFLLRAWLRARGLVPGRDVQLVVVPPPQMPANLKAGHLDGYCVGEPWNSVAVLSGFGRRAATSADIAPRHPEKVLLVRRSFAEARAGEHERLIAALLEACRFCAAPENRERVIETLGGSQYVNAPIQALRASFGAELEFAPGRPGPAEDETLDLYEANEPSADKAAWVLDNLVESGLLPRATAEKTAATDIFRADIFHAALRTHQLYETKPITTCVPH